jgi:endonuclease/exonuclease/phosphatase family metal-dependent hydrolase
MSRFWQFVLIFSLNLILMNPLPMQTLVRVKKHQSLRILDINVWSGLDYRGVFRMGEYEPDSIRETRYQALVYQIRRLNPDIIGIHEANKLPQYVKRLASDTGTEGFSHVCLGGVRIGPIGMPWNLREGDAILVKKALNPQWMGRKQLSGGFVGNTVAFHVSDATQIISVKIQWNDEPFFIFTTHWHASVSDSSFFVNQLRTFYEQNTISESEYSQTFDKINAGMTKRRSECSQTIKFIQQTAGEHPFILMGDLNTEPRSTVIKNLISHHMVDCFEFLHPSQKGYTWNPQSNLNYIKYYKWNEKPHDHLDVFETIKRLSNRCPKRIDYIFFGPASSLNRGEISIQSCNVVMDQMVHGVHASDHFGVLAVITIEN